MHKFHVKYNLGGGERDIYCNTLDDAMATAFSEYRRNVTSIEYGIENHSIDEVIKSIEIID